jgi:hypothetical protein
MTVRPAPARHWLSYGDDPLPTGQEALDEPFAAFPSWFMRITCDRCGKDRTLSETYTPQRDIIKLMRHAGCGGREQGGTDLRHRGRQQPAGAEDRRARRLRRTTPQMFNPLRNAEGAGAPDTGSLTCFRAGCARWFCC